MKNMIQRIVFIALAICVCPLGLCSDLTGTWILHVQNPKHQVVATLKVQFTNEPRAGCMAGSWKAVKVLSSKAKVDGFFPVHDPLSYQVDKGQLTIGRNEVCDGYLWLQGQLGTDSVRGDYFNMGLGQTSPLGYFTLSRSK